MSTEPTPPSAPTPQDAVNLLRAWFAAADLIWHPTGDHVTVDAITLAVLNPDPDLPPGEAEMTGEELHGRIWQVLYGGAVLTGRVVQNATDPDAQVHGFGNAVLELTDLIDGTEADVDHLDPAARCAARMLVAGTNQDFPTLGALAVAYLEANVPDGDSLGLMPVIAEMVAMFAAAWDGERSGTPSS